MNKQESIIVYKDPIQRDFWEFWYNNPNSDGAGLVILVSAVITIVIYLAANRKKKHY